MRNLFIAVTIGLFFCSCSGKNDTRFKGNLTKKYLNGTWIVSDADFPGVKNKSYNYIDSVRSIMQMQILRFEADGRVFSDNADSIPENGIFEVADKTLKLNFPPSKNYYYSLERAADSSMILVIEKNSDPVFEGGKISLKRIDTDQFDIGHPDWKQTPKTPLTDDAVREKLNKMLVYYQRMFLALGSRNVTLFTHTKILMPFRFYSTGIGLRKFETRKGWDVFFGDSTHSRKAYNLLQRCFYNTETPEENIDEYYLVYADILSKLAKNLKAEH